MNIYVGNLSFDAGESDVRALFEAYGAVTSVSIIEDKFTGRPRGFSFGPERRPRVFGDGHRFFLFD